MTLVHYTRLALSGLLVLLFALGALSVSGQSGPPQGPPEDWCQPPVIVQPGQQVDIPVGALRLLRVTYSNITFPLSMSRIVLSEQVSGSSSWFIFQQYGPNEPFVWAWYRLSSNAHTVRVRTTEITGGQVRVALCPLEDNTTAANSSWLQVPSLCTVSLRQNLYDGQEIVLSQPGAILVGQGGSPYRVSWYGVSGERVFTGWLPRVQTSWQAYNVAGPLPPGTYTVRLSPATIEYAQAYYHVVSCPTLVPPTPTLWPGAMTATALALTPTPTATSTAVAGLPLTPIAVTPIGIATPWPTPIVRDVDVGVQPSPEQCYQVVPSLSVDIPGGPQFGWQGLQVCTRSYGFSLRYGTFDLAGVVVAVFSFGLGWLVWTLIRRG